MDEVANEGVSAGLAKRYDFGQNPIMANQKKNVSFKSFTSQVFSHS